MTLEELMPDEDRREAALHRLLELCLADRRYRNGRQDGARWNMPSRQIRNDELTEEELAILVGLSHGLTLSETCVVLGFKYEAVKSAHVRIKRKLRAKTRPHAVANAMRRGLIR